MDNRSEIIMYQTDDGLTKIETRLQALNRKPMYMKDWIERLDDFLKMTGKDILSDAGKISIDRCWKKHNRNTTNTKKKPQTN
ncbi:MAG: RhuM family protein [Proteiniphilum sp.]